MNTVDIERIQGILKNGPFILSHCTAGTNGDGLHVLKPSRSTKLEVVGQIFVFIAFPTIAYFMAWLASVQHNAASSARNHGMIAATVVFAVCLAILVITRFVNSKFTGGGAEYLVFHKGNLGGNSVSSPILGWQVDEIEKIAIYQGKTYSDGTSTSMQTRFFVAFGMSSDGRQSPLFVWEQKRNVLSALRETAHRAGVAVFERAMPVSVSIGTHELYASMLKCQTSSLRNRFAPPQRAAPP